MDGRSTKELANYLDVLVQLLNLISYNISLKKLNKFTIQKL